MKPVKPPEIKDLLPSAAEKALVDFFFERIKTYGVSYTGKIIYSYYDVHQDLDLMKEDKEYATKIAYHCLEEAKKRIDQTYPLYWDNETSRAYRPGLDTRT